MRVTRKRAARAWLTLLAALAVVAALVWLCQALLGWWGFSDAAVHMALGVVLVAYTLALALDWRRARRLRRAVRRIEDMAVGFGWTRAPDEDELAFVERVAFMLEHTGTAADIASSAWTLGNGGHGKGRRAGAAPDPDGGRTYG